jgi:antitoxin MazE
MVKTLTKHGNSYALVIDRPIMDLIKLDPDSPVEVTTDGKSLTITPIRDAGHDERVKQALTWTNTKYGKALKKLAE